MARKYKSRKKVEEPEVFSTSDFSALAVTAGTINVDSVSGASNIGETTNYTASLSTNITEASATLVDVVLTGTTVPADVTLEITTSFPVVLTAGANETDIVIAHTVGADVPETATTSGSLSALIADAAGGAQITSTSFTLSTDITPASNPFAQALPGETELETRGRLRDLGYI